MDELATDLNLRKEDWMQDWPYEITEPSDIEKYIAHYEKLSDEDQKFVLMEAIIQATEDQETEVLFLEYWHRVQLLLEQDFAIHAYTIHYWACFDNEDLEDSWRIAPYIRQLWEEGLK